MSFLAPLFLLGALAVALPIFFHLIRRSARERVPFSSLMFLSATPPRITRRSRIEHVLLLALRCLVLGLLAAGFARPFLRKPVAAASEPEPVKRMMVLIDTSASMRRQNLWPAARAKAEEFLRNTLPGDEVAVFTFDRQTRAVVRFDEWKQMSPGERVPLTLQRLSAISPGWLGTHLGNALTAAAETFEQNLKDELPGPQQIILISDVQEGSRLEGLQGYEWPKGLEVSVEPLEIKPTTNAGLQWVMDSDELLQSTNEFTPKIRVTSASDSKRETFKVRWQAASQGEPVEVYVPPGQSRTVPAPKGSTPSGGDPLVLEGDDESFDNTLYLISAKAEEIRIQYFGNEAETDHTQPLYYLKRAFQRTRRHVAQVFAHRADAAIDPAITNGTHLIIVADLLGPQPLSLIRDWLQSGKLVLALVRTPAAAQSIAQLLELPAVSVEEVAGQRYAMLSEIKFEHPLFSPFADPRYSDFTKIHFWKHRKLNPDELPDAQVLARFDDGSPALLEVPAGKGTLLVLASGWQPADSQLALSSKFVPLLYSLLEQSGGLRPRRAHYLVGDEVSLALTNGPAAMEILLPDGAKVSLGDNGRFSQTALPGLYTVPTDPPQRFAVNLDPNESKTGPLPTEELERLGLPMKREGRKEAPRLSEAQRQHMLATELENQQKLWRWVLLGALGLLVIETWLAGRLTRRAARAT